MDKVAVVILNWNGRSYLEKFLPALVKNTPEKGVGLYVADNGSTDDSLAFLQENYPSVKIVELEKNYGFAEGYNRALAQLQAEYFILLNSDVEVSPGWLEPLVRTMDSDPLIAACMPKIKSFEMKDFFEYAGAAGGYIDKYGYTFCQGRIFDSLETDYGQYDVSREIFWASGACMIVRAPLYKISGGLDPHFFAHFEEIDLCWRLKNRGYKIMVVPSSTVFHVGGGTLPSGNARKTYFNFRNNLLMLYKNLPYEYVGTIIIKRLFLDALSAVRFLLSLEGKQFLAIIRAHMAFYKSLKMFKTFRREERKFITRSEHQEIYNGSIVLDYFFRKKITFKALGWNLRDSGKIS